MTKPKRQLMVFMAAMMCAMSAAWAGETVLDASEDTEVDSHVNYRSKPQGGEKAMFVETYKKEYVGDPESDALIRWDLSQLSESGAIIEVTLSLTCHDWPSGPINVYGIARGEWQEATVTWESWQATEKELVLLGQFKSAGPAHKKGETRFTSPELTQWVQQCVAGQRTNHGLLLQMSGDERGRQDAFSSRETNWEHGHAPRLIIKHSGESAVPSADEETSNETAPLPGQVLKRYTNDVSAVMDLDYDLICYLHTQEHLQAKMQLLAECGFKRLYIVAPPMGDADYSAPAMPEDGPPNFLRQSRELLDGEPLRYAITYAKQAGLEVFVQFKPYEGGGVYTIPHGMTPPMDRNALETLGGQAVGLDPFLVEHPQMRLRRKPIDEKRDKVADRLEMVFVLDRIPGNEGLKVEKGTMEIEQRPGYPKLRRDVIDYYPIRDVELYTSTDNGVYEKYTGDFEVTERIERRLIRNANGELVFPRAVRCRVVEIQGLNLTSPYFSVKFAGDETAFRTIPYSESCFGLYAGEERLPMTVSPRVRPGILTKRYGFDKNGFDFNEQGPMYWDYGWRRQTMFGFARGKDQYIRGAFCEAYPEVRQYWLDQVAYFIELGCDGVDIRLLSHSTGIADFANYGFNPPLVKAYREKHGVDITQQEVDPVKMMQLRGDFFLMFVRDAADLLKQHGLKVQMQTNDFFEHPTLDPTFPGAGFWASPKIVPDWRELIEIVDEVGVKNYNWGTYNPLLAGQIKDAVSAAGKPLWIHCYMQQGHDLNEQFLADVQADSRVTGMMLYEVVYRPGNVLDGIVEITDEGDVRLVPGSPIDQMLVNKPGDSK